MVWAWLGAELLADADKWGRGFSIFREAREMLWSRCRRRDALYIDESLHRVAPTLLDFPMHTNTPRDLRRKSFYDLYTDASPLRAQLDFPPGADPSAKARLLGSLFLMNQLFFEGGN